MPKSLIKSGFVGNKLNQKNAKYFQPFFSVKSLFTAILCAKMQQKLRKAGG